jgi:hypothetical protein
MIFSGLGVKDFERRHLEREMEYNLEIREPS